MNLTLLLEPNSGPEGTYWKPRFVLDSHIRLTRRTLHILHPKNTVDISQTLIAHLTDTPDEEYPLGEAALVHPFAHYLSPPYGFPDWRITGGVVGHRGWYTLIANPQIEGVHWPYEQRNWKLAVLGPNVAVQTRELAKQP